MRKWYKEIDTQRAAQAEERTTRNTGTSETEFTYLMNGPKMPNPYQEDYIVEEELTREATANSSEFSVSRNASSTSLRGRSATGSSTGGSGHMSASRPMRFAMPDQQAPAMHTQISNGAISPGERNAGSYFSPMGEMPPPSSSTRSSSQSTMFSYSRQGTPSNMTTWSEDSNRYTAPAMPRSGSRDGSSGNHNPYFPATRGVQRPSLPPYHPQQNGQPNCSSQSRMRSASSPDIQNHNNIPEARRYMNGYAMQTVDNVPVPPIPAHMTNAVNRSQTSSPTGTSLPSRSVTQSPMLAPPGARLAHPHMEDNPFAQAMPPTSHPVSPPPMESDQDHFMPSQLKAKINFDDNYVTLVIASNILYRSLIDRVDAKLARFTDRSIGNHSVRLRYKDEDGDFVTIDSDEAVQLAVMEWREQNQEMLASGQVGEIQLFCQPVEN